MTKIIHNLFNTLNYIADTQLNARLEKHHSKRYTLTRHGSPLSYIEFESLKDAQEFLTGKVRF